MVFSVSWTSAAPKPERKGTDQKSSFHIPRSCSNSSSKARNRPPMLPRRKEGVESTPTPLLATALSDTNPFRCQSLARLQVFNLEIEDVVRGNKARQSRMHKRSAENFKAGPNSQGSRYNVPVSGTCYRLDPVWLPFCRCVSLQTRHGQHAGPRTAAGIRGLADAASELAGAVGCEWS